MPDVSVDIGKFLFGQDELFTIVIIIILIGFPSFLVHRFYKLKSEKYPFRRKSVNKLDSEILFPEKPFKEKLPEETISQDKLSENSSSPKTPFNDKSSVDAISHGKSSEEDPYSENKEKRSFKEWKNYYYYLFLFFLWIIVAVAVSFTYGNTKFGKYKDYIDFVLTKTASAPFVIEEPETEVVAEVFTPTPINPITPTMTVTLTATPTPTLTPTPTITPTPTKGLESSCIRDDEWTVFPFDLKTLQATPTPGCLSFPEFPLSSTPNGFHFTSPLGQREGEAGIYRNLPKKNFSIDFTIVINELSVSKEDSFSILYFGFIYPDQTNISRSVNMFRLLGKYNYKNCFFYFEDKPLFLDMWDKKEESDEADKAKRTVNENKYKIIVHIDVDENSNLNYVVINDGITKDDSIPYKNFYSEFLIAYNFAYPSTIDIDIENFIISY